jgi:glycosyltransferase involved in cell wall biosynthesis
MRVAHILRKYRPAEWGGTETALCRLVEGLRWHEVESTVYFPRSPRNGPAAAAARDPLKEFGWAVQPYAACVPIWGISSQQRRQLFAVGGNLLSFELPTLLAVEPALDLLHTHTLGRIGGIARTVARRRRVPLVVTIHGGVFDLPEEVKRELQAPRHGGVEWGRIFGWWWKARRVLADADAVVTCNAQEAVLLRERQPRQRIVVQPHGVRTALFRTDHRAVARAAYPQLAGCDLVLCVGRIDAVKNQGWLLRQAPQMLRANPRAFLLVVGACMDARYGAALRDRIAGPEYDGRVALAGGLPPEDPRLIGLLQDARLVVLPSISETFGLVILEAWAAGTPVLASRTSGASALIRHGENGWLFNLGEPISFHAALNRALREPELCRRTAAAGGRLVAAEFDTEVLAGRMRRLYDELIEEKHALRHSARR